MTKTTRRRIPARVAQGNTHTANGINGNTFALTELSKQLLHSSLLGRQLLLIRTIERRAPTASFHDRTGRLGVHSLTRRRNRTFMRTLGASLRRLIPIPTRARTLGFSPALGRFAFFSFRRLGFRRRFRLLRPLSRLDQSTTSLTLRTRFCHELTPLIYKLKSESIVPCQASGRYASGHFMSAISPTTFALRVPGQGLSLLLYSPAHDGGHIKWPPVRAELATNLTPAPAPGGQALSCALSR